MPPKAQKTWYNATRGWLKQNFGSLFVVAISVLGALKFSSEFKEEFQNLAKNMKTAHEFVFPLQSVVESSVILRVTTDVTKYVRRPALENVISTFANASPDMQYLVLYGPRGFGKSSVVEHALGNRTGVINIRCVEGPTPDSVLPNIFQVVAGQNTVSDARVSRDDLITTLAGVRNMVPRRVIVFDISSSVVPAAMRTSAVKIVSGLAKDVSTFVPCIVILSEANAVVEFQDRSRIQYQLVEEMTEKEAHDVLVKLWKEKVITQPLLPDMTTPIMTFIFANLGRSPQDLKSLVKQVALRYQESLTTTISLQEAVQQQIDINIKMAVQDLHRYPRAYYPLLRALKKNPDGITLSTVDYVEWARDAKQSNNNAILYDMINASYKFQKTLYKSAILQFHEEPEPTQCA